MELAGQFALFTQKDDDYQGWQQVTDESPGPVKRGDTFVWQDSMYVKVRRVASDQSWADIFVTQVHLWDAEKPDGWTKRQPLPLDDSFEPFNTREAEDDYHRPTGDLRVPGPDPSGIRTVELPEPT